MATPFVAGTIALALQGRTMTPAEVRQHLEAAAQDRGPAGKDSDWGAGLIDGYAFLAKVSGLSPYVPTAFPAYQRIAGSVGNYGLWTYQLPITQAELGIPIAATITIEGQAKCSLFLLGICFSAQWDPDLDVKLIDPNGLVLSDSNCLADNECGSIGRQETLHAMPTVAGTYTIQVFPAADSGNQGKGGSFHVDLSSGPLTGAAGQARPAVHLGVLTPSWTSNKSGWKASVTIPLHVVVDGNHNPHQGGTVTGEWSGGYSGSSSCTTGSDGKCTVTTGSISKRKTSATFTVTDVTGTLTYTPGSNDGPSSVTVSK